MLCSTILLILAIAYLAYKYVERKYSYWKSKGVPYIKSQANISECFEFLIQREDFIEKLREWYNEYPDKRYIGWYMMSEPVLMVRDKDLIKKITVKDFDHFVDRMKFVDENSDPLMGKSLISIEGERWRNMRNTLSPAFTAAKLRNMFGLIDQVGRQLAEHIDKLTEKRSDKMVELELKELFTRYASDVIATTAFGLQVDSFKDPENIFFRMGTKTINFTQGWGMLRMIVLSFFPFIAKKFKVTMFGSEVNDFFLNLIVRTLREREAKNIIRPDMIHLMMEARKGNLSEDNDLQKGKIPDLSDEDIAGQALLFFFGGFDPTTTCLGFTSYELALNPDIQERLVDEIEEVIADEGGKLTYEGIQKMKYLDMVFSESLRKWPTAVAADRRVTKKYTIPHADDSPALTLNKDQLIWISIYGLHRDPKIFPNPEKFDPERFSDENKDNIDPYTYIPFGSGPRNCIGKRFALLQIKLGLIHLLRKYEIKVVEKTPIPIVFRRDKGMIPLPVGGFVLGLKRRDGK